MNQAFTRCFLSTVFSAVLLAQTVAAAPRAAASSPEKGTLFLQPERVALVDGSFVAVERGLLFVPLVRADTESRVISVELYRFPATNETAAKRPPIFLLPGGPGFAGTEVLLRNGGWYERTIAPFTEIADLVVVGQRGIGSSKPETLCANATERTPAGYRRMAERCRADWEALGFDWRGLNVVEAAADVDDARSALGYEKIILWGGSFGSHWSLAVLRAHGEFVARAVLFGIEGPDHTYDLPSQVLESLSSLAAAADQAASLSPFIPEGGLLAALESTITRVAVAPITLEVVDPRTDQLVTVEVNADDIRALALGYSSSSSTRGGMPTWPEDILRLHAGDYEGAKSAIARRRFITPGGTRTASAMVIDCASGISSARSASYVADPALAILGQVEWAYEAYCPPWGIDLGDDFRGGFRSTVPTIIIQGTWDVSTPYAYALAVAELFATKRLVTVAGGSHNALREGREASDALDRGLMHFVATGEMGSIPERIELPSIEWKVPSLPPKKAATRGH